MKQLYKLIILCLFCLATAFCLACQNDETEIPGGATLQEITFSASQTTPDSLFTRATDLTFSPGDEIGIYVVKRTNPGTPGTLQSAENYAHNKRYIIDDNGQLKPSGESDKIYLSGADTYDFYAYYPYQSYIPNPNAFYFNVLPDQSTAENYTKYDFMLARNLTGQNTGTINLQFQRKFALIETYFEKIPGKTVSKAIIYNRNNSVSINIGSNTITPTQVTTTDITMLKEAENEYYYTFRAIVPVQDIPTNEGLFAFVVDEEKIYYKATTTTPLAPGKKSTYLVDMQYRVYAQTANPLGGTVTGAEKIIFRHGERIDLIATAAPDYTFTGFYDHIEENPVLLSNNLEYSFFASKKMRIYGHFNKNKITITVNPSPSKEVLAPYYDKAQQVVREYGSKITLYGYIVTDAPYTFVGWYENGIYLNRDYEYTFTATQDRTLLAKYCIRAFNLSSGSTYEHLKTPGRHTRTMTDKYNHPTYLKAGQKIQQISNLYYQDLIPNHTLPVIVTKKELIIKSGERIILQTNNFEDIVFTAPENGTYTFHYSMSIEITLLEGEESAGTIIASRKAWYLD